MSTHSSFNTVWFPLTELRVSKSFSVSLVLSPVYFTTGTPFIVIALFFFERHNAVVYFSTFYVPLVAVFAHSLLRLHVRDRLDTHVYASGFVLVGLPPLVFKVVFDQGLLLFYHSFQLFNLTFSALFSVRLSWLTASYLLNYLNLAFNFLFSSSTFSSISVISLLSQIYFFLFWYALLFAVLRFNLAQAVALISFRVLRCIL